MRAPGRLLGGCERQPEYLADRCYLARRAHAYDPLKRYETMAARLPIYAPTVGTQARLVGGASLSLA